MVLRPDIEDNIYYCKKENQLLLLHGKDIKETEQRYTVKLETTDKFWFQNTYNTQYIHTMHN